MTSRYTNDGEQMIEQRMEPMMDQMADEAHESTAVWALKGMQKMMPQNYEFAGRHST